MGKTQAQENFIVMIGIVRLHHPVFTDVSKQAGIQTEGYAHAVTYCRY